MSGREKYPRLIGIAVVWSVVDPSGGMPREEPTVAEGGRSYVVSEGSLAFFLDEQALARLGLAFVAQGEQESNGSRTYFAFEVQQTSTLELRTFKGRLDRIVAGQLTTCGALLLDRPGERHVIGNLSIEAGLDGVLTVNNTLHDRETPPEAVFELTSVMVQFNAAERRLQVVGELSIAESWARGVGTPEATGLTVGQAQIDLTLAPADKPPVDEVSPAIDGSFDAAKVGVEVEALTEGPDIIVADLQSTIRHASVGDITPYGIGTTACNLGTRRADWISYTNQHPVIIQNLYRLKDDKFEQIGMSWMKHGFYAVSDSLCQPCNDPTDGSQLGVGCSDPYSASLNAVQTNMSPRSTANAHTGYFFYPWSGPAPSNSIQRRLQVHATDLYPPINMGARYFIEGHYVHPGDAAAGTHDNNASYREVTVNSSYDLVINPSWFTQREQPAVRAWQDVDPGVSETDIRVPGEGLFILAGKAVDRGAGIWRYSYALYNLNSDRSARSLSVQLPAGAIVTNLGFHNVEYHSGEVYDSTPWQATVSYQLVSWSTSTYAQNPNANALRYSSAYSFHFDVNVEPAVGAVTIGLFKPGTPTDITGATVTPSLAGADCNGNGVPDPCDLDCMAAGCNPPCGGSVDCNNNAVPDECEAPTLVADPSGLEKARFLSFSATSCPETALRVRLTTLHNVVPPYTNGTSIAFTAFEGQSLYVGPPVQYVESVSSGTPFYASKLQCAPHYQDWGTVGLLHVTGSEIVPSSSYEVENLAASCAGNEGGCSAVSAPLQIATTRWGDVVSAFQLPTPPATQPDFTDIGAMVNKFKSAPGAPIKARAMLAGEGARGLINITPDLGFGHISACVDGFKGLAYPYKPGKCTGAQTTACTTDADCGADGPCILCP